MWFLRAVVEIAGKMGQDRKGKFYQFIKLSISEIYFFFLKENGVLCQPSESVIKNKDCSSMAAERFIVLTSFLAFYTIYLVNNLPLQNSYVMFCSKKAKFSVNSH